MMRKCFALVFLCGVFTHAYADSLSQSPIQQIQYVGGVACKQYNCQQRTASLIGVAVFHQECGARPNCNGHAAAYKGSYALSEEQFNLGISAYFPIAQRHDPILYEVLQAEARRLPARRSSSRWRQPAGHLPDER